MKKAYWLVIIYDDIEPKLHGPYMNEEHRDDWAIHHRSKDPEKKNGIFKLDTKPNRHPTIESYSGGFFEHAVI